MFSIDPVIRQPPDSLPPAERLRAVLPVGTNRANLFEDFRFRSSAAIFVTATLDLERSECQT